MLEEEFPAAAGTSAQLVFAAEDGTLSDPAAAAAVDDALADVAGNRTWVRSASSELSDDDRIGYADVQLRPAVGGDP